MYEYTIDQVWLFYEKVKKAEMDQFKTMAILIANAAAYATPSYDQQSASRKQKSWKDFVSAFDWDKVTQKPNMKTVGGFLSALQSAGVKTKSGKDSDK